jgi:hypothetical protein
MRVNLRRGHILVTEQILQRADGRILFSWGSRFGGSGQFIVERDNNPSGFWVVFTVYCLAILLSVGLIIGISFGLFRRLH